MPIKSTAAPSSHGESPFLIRHRNFAEAWEAFAEKQQAAIGGKYNAYYADFDLEGQLLAYPCVLHGHQKLTSVASGLIPVQARYVEETSIVVETQNPTSLTFSLRKSTLPRRLSGYQEWGGKNQFVLKASHQEDARQVLNAHDWEAYLETREFHEITLTKEGTLRIKFFHFINSGVALAEFWRKVEGLVKKL